MAIYTGNELDTITKDDLSGSLINKVTGRIIYGKTFTSKFGAFTRKLTNEAGLQTEEVECANLTKDDFDPDGANWLTRKRANLKALYHKKGKRFTFKTTTSDNQVKRSCLSLENARALSDHLINELGNSSAIDDLDNWYEFLTDICMTKKNMPVCDLNGNTDPDSLIKAVQIVSKNMQMPRTYYNFLGFKREFVQSAEDLVLIIDSSTMAQMNVDSLAGAFNMDKKNLVNNIIELDELPDIHYEAATSKLQTTLTIKDGVAGEVPVEAKTIKIEKLTNAGNDETVTGHIKMMLVSKEALAMDPTEREVTEAYNGEGRFYNHFLHKEDTFAYSPLRNAIVFVG